MSASSLPATKKPMLSDLAYKGVKYTATILLPLLSALYFGLAQIWHFPKTEEVVGTIAIINTFFGGLVQVSKKSYYASGAAYVGNLVVEDHPDGSKKKLLVAHLDQEPSVIQGMDEATFKVNGGGGG